MLELNPKIDSLLQDFISALRATLGNDLVGTYLYGSLASRDFDEELSDIDVLMVLGDDVNGEQLEALAKMHESFNLEHPEWSKRIDVAYISYDALLAFKTKPSQAIVSDGEGGLEVVDCPEYYLIDWYKVQEHGIVLYGVDVNKVLPGISVDEFKRVIYNYILTWSQRVSEASKRGEQAYAVITICRSLFAYREGKHTSKKAGAEWAIHEYPHWSDLIEESLSLSRDPLNSGIQDVDNQQKVSEFTEYILDNLRSNS